MNDHQTRTRWLSQGFRAECSCGWAGEWHPKATPALIDGHAHAKGAAEVEEPVKTWGDHE